jgi:3-oxoacyl-[acyl-carrier-protein] synthase-3
MTVSIVGLGAWLPEEVRTNDAWPENFGVRQHPPSDRVLNDIQPSEDPVAAAILERHLLAEAQDPFLGAKLRRVAPDHVSAAEAESQACLRALEDAGVAPEDVDLVLTQSLVFDRPGPFTAPTVAHRIGAHRALALTVDSVCSSGVTQLQVARAYLESGLARVVVVAQSHLILRAVPFLHPATPGLGDAAAAMVLMKGQGGLRLLSVVGRTHGEYALSVVWVRGADDSVDQRWFKAGGDFRVGSRDPQGTAYLMRETVCFGAKTVSEAARLADVDVKQIRVLASVQPRGFIPEAIAERMGLARECAVTTYEEIAHVGACGPGLNLQKARALGMLEPGAHVALYAQGAGFTRAAAILQVAEKPFT